MKRVLSLAALVIALGLSTGTTFADRAYQIDSQQREWRRDQLRQRSTTVVHTGWILWQRP